ncbi:MAG: hypothetical protein LBJ64_06075 [Deltaproteobacteria bacterium]|jgi:hypothetical protein|nr:hypothetical protein [Deltaproteobacteria bacterium]
MPPSYLSWKTRRELSESPKTTPAQLAAAGQELLASDRLAEASDFLARGLDLEGLAAIKNQAVEEGNLFIYDRVCQLHKSYFSRSELIKLADKAESLGLFAYAKRAKELVESSK